MKILLAVDGSRESFAAARHVAERMDMEARLGELQLIHVCYRVPAHAAALVSRDMLETYYRDVTEEAVAPVRRLLDSRVVPHRIVRASGHPPAEIARYATRGGFDLVVMGSHGKGAASRLLLGSTTQGVLAGCNVPLLVIRPGGGRPAGGVVAAIDGSAPARRALAFLLRHRRQMAATADITLLHVGPAAPQQMPAAARSAFAQSHAATRERALQGARRLLRRARLQWRETAASGDAGIEIAGHAKQHDCSLIVMGSRGRGGVGGLLLGSAVQKTLAACRTPVLIER